MRLAPAERYEIVIDFGRYSLGTRVVLENRLNGVTAAMSQPEAIAARTRDVLAFDIVRRATDDSRVPAILRSLGPLPSPGKARQWILDRQGGFWSINSKQWDPDRVDASPRLNTAEKWHFINKSGGWTHPVHPHLVRFRIVAIQGRSLQAGESGWKDTVWLGPNVSASVVMEFKNFRGRFPLHCHNVSHEDFDMMAQFETM